MYLITTKAIGGTSHIWIVVSEEEFTTILNTEENSSFTAIEWNETVQNPEPRVKNVVVFTTPLVPQKDQLFIPQIIFADTPLNELRKRVMFAGEEYGIALSEEQHTRLMPTDVSYGVNICRFSAVAKSLDSLAG